MGMGDIRTGRFPIQICTQPGLRTQPYYKPPGDLQVKTVENAVIKIGLVQLSPQE